MLARKKLENWLIWIVVDAVSVGIYLYKELYPTAVLFLFLTVLAYVGYRKWQKDMLKMSTKD
jgi:nicotinamide mononucleotide transporter